MKSIPRGALQPTHGGGQAVGGNGWSLRVWLGALLGGAGIAAMAFCIIWDYYQDRVNLRAAEQVQARAVAHLLKAQIEDSGGKGLGELIARTSEALARAGWSPRIHVVEPGMGSVAGAGWLAEGLTTGGWPAPVRLSVSIPGRTSGGAQGRLELSLQGAGPALEEGLERTLRLHLLHLAAGLGLLLSGIGLSLRSLVMRPLRALAEELDRMREGQWDRFPLIVAHGEVKEVVDSLSDLKREFRARVSALVRAEKLGASIEESRRIRAALHPALAALEADLSLLRAGGLPGSADVAGEERQVVLARMIRAIRELKRLLAEGHDRVSVRELIPGRRV